MSNGDNYLKEQKLENILEIMSRIDLSEFGEQNYYHFIDIWKRSF